MYTNPIYSGTVALAHALAVAARVQPQTKAQSQSPDPTQLMLWSECAGRNYVTALGGLLVMKLLQKRAARTPQ
jgi:hypothetical protein